MKHKKILIVEDEQIIAENLRLILNENGYTFVDVAMDVEETTSLFKKNTYDLVLMDINLGDNSPMNGIELIKWLAKIYSFSFLYVTANTDENTIKKAKVTNPAGYIVKPFVSASIYANVAIVLNSIKQEDIFSFFNKGMQQKVLLTDIAYLEADGAYVYIYTLKNTKYLIRKSLLEFKDLYPSAFLRIHKSILINKQHIQGYTSQSVQINGQKLPLGRAFKQQFIMQIKETTFH